MDSSLPPAYPFWGVTVVDIKTTSPNTIPRKIPRLGPVLSSAVCHRPSILTIEETRKTKLHMTSSHMNTGQSLEKNWERCSWKACGHIFFFMMYYKEGLHACSHAYWSSSTAVDPLLFCYMFNSSCCDSMAWKIFNLTSETTWLAAKFESFVAQYPRFEVT